MTLLIILRLKSSGLNSIFSCFPFLNLESRSRKKWYSFWPDSLRVCGFNHTDPEAVTIAKTVAFLIKNTNAYISQTQSALYSALLASDHLQL